MPGVARLQVPFLEKGIRRNAACVKALIATGELTWPRPWLFLLLEWEPLCCP